MAAEAGLKSWHSHGSRLEVISIGDKGEVKRKAVLAEAQEGILRDADVSFDGKADSLFHAP